MSIRTVERARIHTVSVGDKFGSWTVIEPSYYAGRPTGHVTICRCTCGIVKKLRVRHLTTGEGLSCGCSVIRKSTALMNELDAHWQMVKDNLAPNAWKTRREFINWSLGHGFCRKARIHRINPYLPHSPLNTYYANPRKQRGTILGIENVE